MKKLLVWLLCACLALSLLPTAAFAAQQDLQAIIDAGAEETIVLEADASNVTIDRDTTIDLNGHNIDGVTVTGGTLHCLDSQTADYTVADGVYGHLTNVTGNVAAAEGYLQVGDSFHAVNLDIYAMTLRAADVGVYYKSNFAADEIVAAQVESFGVALSVVTAPNAQNLETYCGYSEFTGFAAGEGANATGTSTLLKGIMKAANGDNKNAKNAAMPVYGRAYIKTAEGYVFGETVKRSLQEQVEAIDGVWVSLTDAQKDPVLRMLEAYAPVMEGWNIPYILGIQTPGTEGAITVPVEVPTENGIVTEAATVEQTGVSVTVPAGVKLAEGAEKLTLTVTPKETSDIGIKLEKNEVLMPMDVHVAGLAADNAQPLTIYLGKVMAENLNMGNYTVYHMENGNANEMVLISVDEAFTAHNQYKYTLDGELTLYMATFSEVAVVSNEENAWNGDRDYTWYNTTDTTLYIRNADQLAGFGAIVGGMDGQTADDFAGKTVVLLADISIGDIVADNGKVFYPIGYYNETEGYDRVTGEEVASWFNPFKGTFDGNGNTISDFYQNTWEMFGDYNDGKTGYPNYYREGMGLFGKIYGGTVKNLTVDNFKCDSEHGTTGTIAAYADCGATFESIAIFNCNPRVYNIGNGGIVGCIGWYATETAENPVTLKNITVDKSNKISALWGTYDASCGGLVGQYYPTSGQEGAPKNPGISMVNCHVSAEMDVNNDVCGNYQYYWYRYCGMLIGSVRTNTVDPETGLTMADITGITAENCEANFGDWNQYWYCELVANSKASYTHDHQMSRLTQISDLAEILSGDTWTKAGNFLLINGETKTCYHIVEQEGALVQHTHEATGTEEVNGKTVLVEDKQIVYLPFNQLLTGYGWGIKAHYELENVTVNASGGTLTSQKKFDAPESYVTVAGELKLSDLFTAKDGAAISAGTVQAYISPVGENSTVKPATCVITNGDWQNGILKIEGYGEAKITITDYWYCMPTTLDLTVRSYTEPLTFKEGTQEAYCPVCKTYVTWTAFSGNSAGTQYVPEINDSTAHYHYYFPADVDARNVPNYFMNLRSGKVCLHLNGHDLLYGGYFMVGSTATLNIMGTGEVVFTATNTNHGNYDIGGVYVNYGTVNLYGGTYSVAEDALVEGKATIHQNNGKLTIKEATVKGRLYIPSGTATLETTAKLDSIQVDTKGKLSVKKNWTGSAEVTFAAALVDNVVPTANGVAEGPFAGSLKMPYGITLQGTDAGTLIATGVNTNLVLDANSQALCPVCNTTVTWTAFSGNSEGTLGLSTIQDGKHHHLYLPADVDATNVPSMFLNLLSSSKLCLHLNGHSLTYGGYIMVGGTTTMNIMGIGNTTFTDTNEKEGHYDIGGLYGNGGTINIYGGTHGVAGRALELGKPTLHMNGGLVYVKNAVLQGANKVVKGGLFLEKTALVEDIWVETTGKLNVKKNWTGEAQVTFAAAMNGNTVPTANGASDGAFTGTLKMQYGVTLKGSNAGTLTATGINAGLSLDANSQALCPVCNELVTWTVFSGNDAETAKLGTISDGAHHHRYLAADADARYITSSFVLLTGNSQLCLHLNGHQLRYGSYMAVSAGSTLNIMGSGNVSFTATHANNEYNIGGIYVTGGDLNLYGGAYSLAETALTGNIPMIYHHKDRSSDKTTVKDATVNGRIDVLNGTLILEETAQLENVQISSTGKLTVARGWTGTAVAEFAAALVDNAVPAANGAALGAFTGSLTMSDGTELVADGSGKLVKKDA